MVMPGRCFTRSSACAERVPPPLGRPRRAPVPPPAARRGAAGGCRPWRAGRAIADATERAVRRLEQFVLLDVGLELLQARLNLFALLVEKIRHDSVSITRHRAARTGSCSSAFEERFELLK